MTCFVMISLRLRAMRMPPKPLQEKAIYHQPLVKVHLPRWPSSLRKKNKGTEHYTPAPATWAISTRGSNSTGSGRAIAEVAAGQTVQELLPASPAEAPCRNFLVLLCIFEEATVFKIHRVCAGETRKKQPMFKLPEVYCLLGCRYHQKALLLFRIWWHRTPVNDLLHASG